MLRQRGKNEEEFVNSSGLKFGLKFNQQYYYLGLGYVLIGLVFLGIQSQSIIPIRHLTKDPLAIVDEPFYFGALSNIGILLWCASVSTCLFSFVLLKLLKLDEKMSQFFLASGFLGELFMVDDLFMLHEEVFPKYLYIKETFVYVVYAVLFALYLLKFRRILLNNQPLIFGAIMLCLAISITCDVWLGKQLSSAIELLIEDGFKLTAIFTWFIYFSGIALHNIRHYFQPS